MQLSESIFVNLRILYLLTYLLTPWSRVLLEKLTASAASQEILHILWNPKVKKLYRHYKIYTVDVTSVNYTILTL
jgi:hypothetical protein